MACLFNQNEIPGICLPPSLSYGGQVDSPEDDSEYGARQTGYWHLSLGPFDSAQGDKFTTDHWLLTTFHLPPSTFNLPPSTFNLPPSTFNLPLATGLLSFL